MARAHHLQSKAFVKLYDLENATTRMRQQQSQGQPHVEENQRFEKSIENLIIARELQPKNEEI